MLAEPAAAGHAAGARRERREGERRDSRARGEGMYA